MRIVKMTMVSFILLMIALPLYAGGRLTYYCSTDIPWCELMKKEFEKRTGIRVSMTRASSGETLTKIRACVRIRRQLPSPPPRTVQAHNVIPEHGPMPRRSAFPKCRDW